MLWERVHFENPSTENPNKDPVNVQQTATKPGCLKSIKTTLGLDSWPNFFYMCSCLASVGIRNLRVVWIRVEKIWKDFLSWISNRVLRVQIFHVNFDQIILLPDTELYVPNELYDTCRGWKNWIFGHCPKPKKMEQI